MTADDKPMPTLHLQDGHLIRGWHYTHPDGTTDEDIYMRCTDLQRVRADVLARVHAEDRAYPSLASCGRHDVE